MIWMRNTDGQKDAMLTIAFIAFLICGGKLLLNGVSIVFGGNTYGFGSIDAGLIGAMLTPTLGAYVFRRYTDVKYDAVQSLDPGKGPGMTQTQVTKTEVRVESKDPQP